MFLDWLNYEFDKARPIWKVVSKLKYAVWADKKPVLPGWEEYGLERDWIEGGVAPLVAAGVLDKDDQLVRTPINRLLENTVNAWMGCAALRGLQVRACAAGGGRRLQGPWAPARSAVSTASRVPAAGLPVQPLGCGRAGQYHLVGLGCCAIGCAIISVSAFSDSHH